MPAVSLEGDYPQTNPLDLVEEIVSANEWTFQRVSDDEILVNISGHWCNYCLCFTWCRETSAMHFVCAFNLKLSKRRRAACHELLAMINAQMWLGHFDLSPEGDLPTFRHTVLLRGARGASVEQLEDLVDVAVSQCERFYPAFQFVLWDGRSPVDAVAAALFDTVGEA